jgi:CRP-like cAMP-binding protein
MTSQNHFLGSLGGEDLAAIRPHLEEISLRRDQLVTEAGHEVSAAYLPLNCILSVITMMPDGAQVESRTIGRESGYGLLHALGSSRSHERMLCQVAGRAVKIPLRVLTVAALARPSLTKAIASHAQVTLIQTAQTVACNALHPALPRMTRWLLMTQDRLSSDILPLTQEHLAIMLGVQRTTITAVAGDLQARSLIACGRGRIQVLDREGLMRVSCDCYDAIQLGVEAIFRDSPSAVGV